MKQYRSALILFGVLFILGGLATWDEWQTKKEGEEKKTQNRLIDFKLEDVEEVTYKSTGEMPESSEDAQASTPTAPVEVVAVKKTGWDIVRPVEALAESSSVESLIKTVAEYSYTKVVAESKEQWASFGLTQPAREVTIKFIGEIKKEPFTVYVGSKAPVGYSVYLATNRDDKVYLGSQYLLTALTKSLFDLRDKTIVKLNEADVKELVYERRGFDPIVIEKDSSHAKIVSPQSFTADASEIRSFLEDLKMAKATGFEDTPSSELVQAFATPDYRVRWKTDKDVSGSFDVVSRNQKLFAAFGNPQRFFELGDEFKQKIVKDLIDFRDRRVFAMEVADAQEVEIDGAIFKNQKGEWFKAEDIGKKEAKEAVHIRALLVDLEFAKTDRFFQQSEVANALSKAPQNKLTIRFVKPEPLVIETFAADDASDKYLVRRSGSEVIYRVPKAVFNSLKPSEPANGAGEQSQADGIEPQGFDQAPELEFEEGQATSPHG